MSFRFLYLERAVDDGDEPVGLTCDLCCDPEWQDILDAPLDRKWGVELRPIWRDTRPGEHGFKVCQKCLADGSWDASEAGMQAVRAAASR